MVHMRYAAQDGALRSAPDGITLSSAREDDTTWLGIWGQPRPTDGAGKELEERWRDMEGRQGKFDGQPDHSSDYRSFFSISAVGSPDGSVLYEVSLNLYEKSLVPRQVNERRDQLLDGLKLKAERQ
jgi:hypothetical protein